VKNKLSRTSKIQLIIAAIIIMFGIIAVVYQNVEKIEKTATSSYSALSASSARAASAGTIAPGEKNPATFSYGSIIRSQFVVGRLEGEVRADEEYDLPNGTGFADNFYCIKCGTSLICRTNSITYPDALKLNGKEYTSGCGCAQTPREGQYTGSVYVPSGGLQELSPAPAYVISDAPLGIWTPEKQYALYLLHNEGKDGGLVIRSEGSSHYNDPGVQAGGEALKKEAVDYLDFDQKVRNTGLKPTDTTDLARVETKVNQNTDKYTVGPFSITYTEGTYGNLTFGGISNMTIIGYNEKKQEVRNNIKIEAFVLTDSVTSKGGSSVAPQYFEPSADLKVDRSAQVYPKSGQAFQVIFSDPNSGLSVTDPNRVAYISIKVNFKYMLANGKYQRFNGTSYTVCYSHQHYNYHTHPIYSSDAEGNVYVSGHYDCNSCKTRCYLRGSEQQPLISAEAIRTIYEQCLDVGKDAPVSITMDLGGHVWEDGVATKETKSDGVSNTKGDLDRPLKNVRVTLYVYGSSGKAEIAELLSDEDEAGISNEKIMHRVNPTYTDEKGNYLFEGLDPMKKYYVKFDYNGQTYLPTEYLNTANKQYTSVTEMVNAGLYNTNEWKVTSKASELPTARGNTGTYDTKYEEIGSYPNNYKSSNSLGKVGEYNATYTQKDLMGYTLSETGTYSQTTTQLVDGYLYDEIGIETAEFKEGVISKRVREFTAANRKYPNENEMKQIYAQIAGNNMETWRMLQFIEDSLIQSYTKVPTQNTNYELYPVYDAFKINHAIGNVRYETAEQAQNGNYGMQDEVIDGVRYRIIYPGQFFINLGLWRRQESDLSLRKDVYRAGLKINDKTIIYKYDKRTEQEDQVGTNEGDGKDNDTYWDINVRMADYNAYYATGYNRELYLTDYEYDSKALGHPGVDLEIFITYKLTIRNQSMSIMNQVKEVVDYYDQDYKYREDLSWVMYRDDSKNTTVTEDEYYKAIDTSDDANKQNLLDIITNGRPINSSSNSKYGSATHSDVTNTYQAVYVKGLEDKKLATGESAYIYLTFQVKKDAEGRVILDEERNGNTNTPKQNIAEINGYKTYYKDGTELPNNVKVDSGIIAGLIDRDSNPGNLVQADITGNKYEKNFEDDTDRAKGLRVIIDEEAIRKANGNVWEDERTETSGESIIGDGIREDSEQTVEGVTVQLVEKTIDGREYIWYETKTNGQGKYDFKEYIPGDYVIRFYYGHNYDTVKTKDNGGKNDVSYNGQDFKSTTYQKELQQNAYTDESNRFTGYTQIDKQNESGTFGYDIYQTDLESKNLSDAKDLWSTSKILERIYHPELGGTAETRAIQGRMAVNSYSTENVTNGIAEILASPYEVPIYNGNKYSDTEMNELINELINNTYMIAETGVIVIEFEYDRQQSEGLKEIENNKDNSSSDYVEESNRYNSGYELNNIDLGLVERPKAQLESDKSIENIKVILANNSILFDVKESTDNLIWKDHEEYNLAQYKQNLKYDEFYGKNGYNRYSFKNTADRIARKSINNIVKDNDNGLIQITMDEELMHGSTIEITYKLKMTNVGEIDYEGEKFYYKGDATDGKIVTTTANQVVDYVANNLQFNGNNPSNNGWKVITVDDLKNKNLVNARLSDNLQQFNTIIETDGLGKALKPGELTEKILILSQLITTENTSDDLTYRNMMEIVKTSNTVGRRMAYSVVGNQHPTSTEPEEIDASAAERVIILPPFGERQIYYILGAVMAIILIGGITLIIKKVLRKKD